MTPTIGQIVHYHARGGDIPNDGPLAAIVAYVWSDTLVNLMVIDSNGHPHSQTSIPLLADGDPDPGMPFATWPPIYAPPAPLPDSPAAV